jgi:hypothetical protein
MFVALLINQISQNYIDRWRFTSELERMWDLLGEVESGFGRVDLETRVGKCGLNVKLWSSVEVKVPQIITNFVFSFWWMREDLGWSEAKFWKMKQIGLVNFDLM